MSWSRKIFFLDDTKNSKSKSLYGANSQRPKPPVATIEIPFKFLKLFLKDNKLNFTLNHPNEKINPKDIFKIFQFSQSKNLDIHHLL